MCREWPVMERVRNAPAPDGHTGARASRSGPGTSLGAAFVARAVLRVRVRQVIAETWVAHEVAARLVDRATSARDKVPQ
jgi:hypothetical protein